MRMRWHRRPKGDVLRTSVIWEIYRNIWLVYFGLFHNIRFLCVSNIPAHGPVVFAPNHVSYYDPPMVAAGIPYGVRFMAWDKLFKVPFLGWFIRNVGAYPVKLQSADKAAFEQTLRILRNRECVMIFPEGERSRDGELQPLQQGVARVALQTGASVVPVSITGMYRAWPRTKTFPRWFTPIVVKYHPPIPCAIPATRDELKMQMEILNEQISRPIRRRLKAAAKLEETASNDTQRSRTDSEDSSRNSSLRDSA